MFLGLGLWFILAAIVQPNPWGAAWWLLSFGSSIVGSALTNAARSNR